MSQLVPFVLIALTGAAVAQEPPPTPDEQRQLAERCLNEAGELHGWKQMSDAQVKAGRPALDKEIQQALRKLNSCRENQLVKIRAERFRAAADAAKRKADAEEKARADAERLAAETKAADEEAAFAEKMKADRNVMAAVFGLALCQQRAAKTAALAEIAKEKKYARIGGIERMRKIYDLQEDIRAADEATAQIRAFLRTYDRVHPSGCAAREVKALLACSGDDAPATCTADAKTMWMVGFAADLARKDE